MPNGKYYAAKVYNINNDTIYERQDSSKVFRYNDFDHREYLWYNFDANPGDTINTIPRGSDTTDIILYSAYNDTIFGFSRRHWTFIVDYFRLRIDDEEWDTIVDTIGLASITQAFGYTVLEGSVINGTKYGVIDMVRYQDNEIPPTFSLSQNFPQPFNPITTIQFTLPHESHVTLKVYNLLGQEVQTLVNDTRTAGIYSVDFNAGKLSSGVYFYRLQAGGFVQTKKMIIVR